MNRPWEMICRWAGQAAQHAALLYPLCNCGQSSYCKWYPLILEYKKPNFYRITQRIQPPCFLFISTLLLCSSYQKLRNTLAFTGTGKYIFSYSHRNPCKFRHCMSQWDLHSLRTLCRTPQNFRDCFPHAHQGLLLNCKFYAMAIAHRFNLRGKYQDFPNRTNAACSSRWCVSSTKVLCCSVPSFTLHNCVFCGTDTAWACFVKARVYFISHMKRLWLNRLLQFWFSLILEYLGT